jgi:two-component system, NtrC family, nitrogen regulation sensor histidine kinase NtrY
MSLSRQVLTWASRIRLGRKLAVALAVAAIASGIGTYAALSGWAPFKDRPHLVLPFVNLNLVLLLALAAVIAKRLVQVWAERRRGHAGSRLHVRLVVLFSVIAVTPTIILALSSYFFFSFGVQSWFSDRVRTALSESLAVAEAYLHEHQDAVRGDIVKMASDLNHDAQILNSDPQNLAQVLELQTSLRNLSEALVFDPGGRVLGRTRFSYTLMLDAPPGWALKQADDGDVAVLTSDSVDRVRALVRLGPAMGEAYLYVGRIADPVVLNRVQQTKWAVEQYERLEGQRSDYQIKFALGFLVVAVLILLAAVWAGLSLAARLARPISALAAAAERVGGGDLTARVSEGEGDEEFGTLSRAFNRMTTQIETQQRELVEANRQLDGRRRFTEAVLSGVSAGVIGLDRDGRINLPNRSASVLLGVDLDRQVGETLSTVVAEMAGLVEEAARRPDRLAQAQIEISRDGRSDVLHVRVAAERVGGETQGYVVTFDDVTELLSAQRKAAWADVARRIAHEIKNPLTPIQLSAERLKRKYLRQITNDPETFSILSDTIIRHVGDIGRMVDEFSSFARMPAATIKTEDLIDITRQAVFLQRAGTPDIRFEVELPSHPVPIACDSRQVSQALVNLLKNAIESIQGRDGDPAAGRIWVRLIETEGQITLVVEDNGRGLPREGRERLTEPYVTTRAKGTGLGLAIVKKVMEEHGGELVLEDREGGGARVKLIFPSSRPHGEAERAAAESVEA